MSSKSERITFSGRVDDFLYFAEQIEARIHSLKLRKLLPGDATHEDYKVTIRNGSSEEQIAQAVKKEGKN